MEQPNNTDDLARLTPRFWAALLLTAGLAGLAGIATVAFLHGVQLLAFGQQESANRSASAGAGTARLLLAPVLGGVVVGAGLLALRRSTRGSADVDDTVWTGSADLGVGRSVGVSTLSLVAVGSGASLGREAAPKLLAAAAASALARTLDLDSRQRRLLVACGAGAGMAAVYNVPLGGALVACEVLLGQLALPLILPALVCAALATAASWLVLPTGPVYPGLPAFVSQPGQVLFAVAAGPLIGLVAVAFVRLVGRVSHHRPSRRGLLVGPPLAFGLLAALALQFPLLLGNGREITATALGEHPLALGSALALLALKPLVTALCLGSGATGGLFTPVLSTGALLGLVLAHAWAHGSPGSALGPLVFVTAGAFLGACTQAPLSSVVLVLELTRTAQGVVMPLVLATALATLVARQLDGYSIYSARLSARGQLPDGA